MIVYLSTSDLARRWRVTPSAVSQMARRGQLPDEDAQISDRYGWLEATIVEWEARKGK
jgi:hypothetical protein